MAANRQRGLLRVVGDLGIVTPVETSAGVFTAPDNGVQRAAASVAGDFASLGDKIGKMADHAAAKEGAAAGQQAGLDPEFRPTRLNTIRGEAYDRAGLDVYRTRQELAVAEELDKVYRVHHGDPQKLEGAIATTRAAWLQSSLPETRADLDVSFGKHRLTMMRQSLREQEDRVRHEAAAAAQERVAQNLKIIQQRAYSLGLDPQADEVLASDIADLRSTLSRRGPDGNPLVPPEAAGKLLRAAREDVATARLMGAFNRLPDLETKQRFLTQMRVDFAAGRGLAGEFDLDGVRRVESMLSAEMQKEATRVSADERAVKHEVDQLFQMAGKGYGVPPDQMSALSARVAGLRNPEVAAAFDEARDLMSWHEQARGATPEQLAQHLSEMRTAARERGASPRLVRRIEIGERLLGEMRTQIKSDPLGWAERSGIVDKVAPLDFSDPARAGMSLKARIGQADAIAARYGISPVYLRPDEVRTLGAEMAKGGDHTLAVNALMAAAGDRAPAIMRQLSDHAPSMAYLGGLQQRMPDAPVATDAAAGLALRRTLDKDFHPMAAPAAKLREAAESVLGGAMSQLPVNLQGAIDTATAAYEVRARRKGLTAFDDSEWKAAFREALGERVVGGQTYGGVYRPSRGWFSSAPAVVLPHDMTGTRFEGALDALRIDDLKDVQGRPPAAVDKDGKERPVALSDIRSGTLVTVGAGRYRIALSDPSGPDPQYLVRGGKPFVLDFAELSDLRRRRPDLFLGAEVPRYDGEPVR